MQRGIRETSSTRCTMHGGHKELVCCEIKFGLVTRALGIDGALVVCTL